MNVFEQNVVSKYMHKQSVKNGQTDGWMKDKEILYDTNKNGRSKLIQVEILNGIYQ